MPAEFDLRQVEGGIVGTRFSSRLMHFPGVGSTNQLASEAALNGVLGGVWIADEQKAGRGRGGHSWHSPPGSGLYVSALVRPCIPTSHAWVLPLATGLAAQAAILAATGLAVDIRWPNDLMFGDRKCGGILVESASPPAASSGAEANVRHAVIGIGINVNHVSFPGELGKIATSLAIESGRNFPREPLLASLLQHLENELGPMEACCKTDNVPDILRRFARASTWVEGKRVKVNEVGAFTGVTRGLDVRGCLLVEDDAGIMHTVLSGGVRSA